MLFNTIDFVIFFIVVVSMLVMIKNRKFQHLFLLAASYFFFYYSSNYLITLLIFTTIWDFYLGKEIWKSTNLKKRKYILILSLAGNLGLLGFFKYTDFAITQFNILGHYFNLGTQFPLLHIVLPIGISFYTFHSITYTVGIYRRQITPVKSFTEYAIFVAFFPQLVAGPILRAKDFLPQLREKIGNSETGAKLRQIIITNSNLKLGITIMAIGFLKKMFFADNIAPMVNDIFNYPIGAESYTIILGAVAFGIQVYCDFSGYTDIAIGASVILGFTIPANFNKPFFANSPSDYWKRWHISLSSWVRDYLYTPLAFSNRKSKTRLYIILVGVMVILGLWHGASWNFIIYGLIWGLALAFHRVILDKIPSVKFHPFFKTRIGTVFSILVTQYIVFFSFIAFRIKDFEYMIYSMKKYVFMDFSTTLTSIFLSNHKTAIVLLLLFTIMHFISYKKGNLPERIANLKSSYWIIFLATVMLAIFLFYSNNPQDFIYFQF